MRKRHQQGSLTKVDGRWIAQWWEEGSRRKKTLGKITQMTKAQALQEVEAIVSPINAKQGEANPRTGFRDFYEVVYLPFYRRRWKRSTAFTNEARMRLHLVQEFDNRALGTFTRDELQTLLEQKAASGMSFSVMDHLRWDLKQLFEMAVAEGYLRRNPAQLLFTPRALHTPEKRFMTAQEVKTYLDALNLRERLVVKLAVLAGMRPGEILGLRWGRVYEDHVDVQLRVYRGDLDTPKTRYSIRRVALPKGLGEDFAAWREVSKRVGPDDWVFPSENPQKPILLDNLWWRNIRPVLEKVGLKWTNFQVMRRTHSSLMNELEVDPKTVADQLGHTLDVNQNVYTKAALRRRQAAVNALETAIPKA